MTILGVIPARFESTRFPGKPLALIHGKTMIQHVYENASKCCSLTQLIVATDDHRIFDTVKAFGGEVMMTSKNHNNGTERCNEVLLKLNDKPNIIINIQGDEPFIQASQIQLIIDCFNKNLKAEIVTLVKKITAPDDLKNPNIVKADLQSDFTIKNFSRKAFAKESSSINYKHLGIYGFKPQTLKRIAILNLGIREIKENLEQLRWLENGYSIHYNTSLLESKAIDSPKDLENLC